ncbi:MAG: ROK family protein [Actinobacteria bacterium]|nr:ROK family protein [Actinomycetota bacterium]
MAKVEYRSLKEHNTGLILKKIIEEEDVTRIKISKDTGLPKSTVSDLVGLLLNKKVIIETKRGHSQVGKKPIILKINEEFKLILALDIGQVNLTSVVANLNGEILYKIEHKNYPRKNRKEILESIINILDTILDSKKDLLKRINHFSVGTHGVVDPNTNIITKAPYLRNWSGVNIVEVLNESYKKKVILNNSNNLGAIGEQWKNFKKIKNLMYIDIENGIGAGIILNNSLVTGHKGTTGEISYLPILKELDISKLRENKFELGLFERQVDINGILMTVKKYLSDKKIYKYSPDFISQHDIKDLDFYKICVYYKNSTPNVIKEIIDGEIIRILAVGIASIISVIGLEMIIINGDILELGEKFIENLKNEIFSITPFKCRIVQSRLRKEAHITGALKNGIDYINNLFYNSAFSVIK